MYLRSEFSCQLVPCFSDSSVLTTSVYTSIVGFWSLSTFIYFVRAGTAQKTQEFNGLCRNVRDARRILIFVGSNDIRTANTTPDKEANRDVLNILHMVRALWRLVHPSTRISIVDLWKRKNVTPAWEKTARLINSWLNRLKVDVVRVAKKIRPAIWSTMYILTIRATWSWWRLCKEETNKRPFSGLIT